MISSKLAHFAISDHNSDTVLSSNDENSGYADLICSIVAHLDISDHN